MHERTGVGPECERLHREGRRKSGSWRHRSPCKNLSRQKIYVFHGYNDALVAKAATDAATDFYRHYLGDSNRGNLFYQTTLGAGHSFVVAEQRSAGELNDCKDNKDPHIDQCGYDQAGIILQHIYGRLKSAQSWSSCRLSEEL